MTTRDPAARGAYGRSNGNGRHAGDSDGGGGEGLARALGWVSLGLGIAGVAAPGAVAQLIGVRDDEKSRAVLRLVGLREIASGVGLLTQTAPGWAWSRVGGDVMDLALLVTALNSDDSQRERVVAATAAVAGITALDLYASERLRNAGPEGRRPEDSRYSATKAITVSRPVEEVYRFWRDFTNFPRFMRHLESLEVTGEGRSHWRARGPAGMPLEWDAEIVEDVPNERLAWRTLPGAIMESFGRVHFSPAPGDRGTEVRWEMRYSPPGGAIDDLVARLFGKDPEHTMPDDLRASKQLIEIGQIVRSDGALRGPHFPQRPAQPPSDKELSNA